MDLPSGSADADEDAFSINHNQMEEHTTAIVTQMEDGSVYSDAQQEEETSDHGTDSGGCLPIQLHLNASNESMIK